MLDHISSPSDRRISVVAVPKPFVGHTATIQANALGSWARLPIAEEIIVFGNGEGVRDAAESARAIYCPDVECDSTGTPLVDDIFRRAAALARTDWLCYVNADIILMPEFSDAVSRAISTVGRGLIISRRWNLEIHQRLSFSEGWHEELHRKAASSAELFTAYGIDVFVFPKDLFSAFPPFALGRSAWDNWIVAEARRRKCAVVDVTAPYTVIHQNHEYSGFGSMEDIRRSQQGLRNFWLAGDSHFLLGRVDDATHRLAEGAIVSSETKSVSVVVSHAGSAAQLRHCLRILSHQTYPHAYLQLIVVDNSSDASASATVLEFPYVRLTREQRPGPSATRNKGAAIADGDLIAFLDSDCQPGADWVESAVAVAAQHGFTSVVASNIKPILSRGGSSGVRLYEAVALQMQRALSSATPACSASAVMVPRAVWAEAGAFDERFTEPSCEDWEWSTRASAHGIRIVLAADSSVRQPVARTWRGLGEKSRRKARGELRLAEQGSDRPLLKMSSLRRVYATRLFREMHAVLGHAERSAWTRLMAATAAAWAWFWKLHETRKQLADLDRRRSMRRVRPTRAPAQLAVNPAERTRAATKPRRRKTGATPFTATLADDSFRHRSSDARIACVTWPRVSKGSVSGVDRNVAAALAAIGRLGASRPDLICLPEGFLYAGVDAISPDQIALEPDSPPMTLFSRIARDLGLYLVVPFLERNDRAIHNAVAVFDRNGRLTHTHRKRLLWPSTRLFDELEFTAVPGNGVQPVNADFGVFGIQVCMEVHSPGPWRRLRREGVKLILFPSEQSGGMLLRHRAWQTRAFVVSAVSKGGPSQVIDPIGNVIAEWGPTTPNPVVDLGLSFELVHFDHNAAQIKRLAAEYKDSVELTAYSQERIFRITSRDPAVDVRRLLREREILTLDDYLRRAREASHVARRLADASDTPSVPRRTEVRTRTVSIIVPSLGIPENLPACLRALERQQTDVATEIILVIHGPEAETIEFDWSDVTIVRKREGGPAAARNAGVSVARGELLAFIDSDCVAAPDWLRAATATAASCHNRCVVAGSIARTSGRSNRIGLFDRATFLQQEAYVRRFQAFFTANCFVPRAVFERVGPFDERFKEAAYEDREWALRAGRQSVSVVYDPGAAVTIPCLETWAALRAKVELLTRGEFVLKKMTRPRLPRTRLLEMLWRQTSRIAGNRTLSVAERTRIMPVGAIASYWSWRAARRFRRSLEAECATTTSPRSGQRLDA
jgi:GT2 family glycosyltransferase/predicted amidohydrolase